MSTTTETTTTQMKFVGCEDCCDDVYSILGDKTYVEYLRQRGSAALDQRDELTAEVEDRNDVYEELCRVREELDAVKRSNRVNYDDVTKLMHENAELKVKVEDLTLDVDEGRVLLERSHERNRKNAAEVAKLKAGQDSDHESLLAERNGLNEELSRMVRVNALGPPSDPSRYLTPSQCAAVAAVTQAARAAMLYD